MCFDYDGIFRKYIIFIVFIIILVSSSSPLSLHAFIFTFSSPFPVSALLVPLFDAASLNWIHRFLDNTQPRPHPAGGPIRSLLYLKPVRTYSWAFNWQVRQPIRKRGRELQRPVDLGQEYLWFKPAPAVKETANQRPPVRKLF